MKTFIILGALIVSTGAFAQTRPEVMKTEKQKAQSKIEQKQKEANEKAEKGQQMADEKVSQAKDKVEKAKSQAKDKMEEAKEMLNDGNAYGKDKVESTGREFGQNRAAAAKAKAEEVKTESEAEEMIETSKGETMKIVQSIDEKMITARQKLTEKLESGEYSQAQFDEKMVKLMEFEKRKSSIMNSIK